MRKNSLRRECTIIVVSNAGISPKRAYLPFFKSSIAMLNIQIAPKGKRQAIEARGNISPYLPLSLSSKRGGIVVLYNIHTFSMQPLTRGLLTSQFVRGCIVRPL